jgi:hypothetical protein
MECCISIITSYLARKFASHFRSEAVGRQGPAAKTHDATSAGLMCVMLILFGDALARRARSSIHPANATPILPAAGFLWSGQSLEASSAPGGLPPGSAALRRRLIDCNPPALDRVSDNFTDNGLYLAPRYILVTPGAGHYYDCFILYRFTIYID